MTNTKPTTEQKTKRRARAKLTTPTAASLRSSATDRAFNSFARAVGRETTKANKLELARREAFVVTIDVWIEELNEEAREAFFRSIEAVATETNARRIATHPLRPEWLDEEVEEDAATKAIPQKAPAEGSAVPAE